MKQLIILVLIVQATIVCYSQDIDWSTTRKWKIYDLNSKPAFYYPVDTLANFKSASMNDSTVISFLSHAVVWPKDKVGRWVGLYIASYETANGQLRKIVVSNYGGFLFESASRKYYELPRNLRTEWNEFIIGNLQKVFEE